MKTNKFLLLFLSITLFFSSCSSDDDNSNITPLGDYENGLLISHEGNFGQGNASVSYVSYDFTAVEHNIFNAVNGNPLGDTAQSIAFNGDLAYIVLNVSNTIEIVNRYSFESVGTISSGLDNPRHIAFANGKGYVTNWGDGGVATDDYLAIIDLNTNTLAAETISVEEGPETIVAKGDKVYVAHLGGYGQNNIVTVVNSNSDTVATTIVVGDVPNSMQFDSNNNLWVLTSGTAAWTGNETGGKLSKINTADNSVVSHDFETTEHPNNLVFENGTLYYYMSGGVYKMESSASVLPTTAHLTGVSFYGMSVRNSVLYGVDAGDFTTNGSISAYDLNSNTLSNSATLGIIPGGIYFN